MKLEDKLIKAVKRSLKDRRGFILIYNGETNKMESAAVGMCYHEIAEVLDDYLLEDEEESDYIPRVFLPIKKIEC